MKHVKFHVYTLCLVLYVIKFPAYDGSVGGDPTKTLGGKVMSYYCGSMNFVLIVVLFVLLVIVGTFYVW